MQQYFSANQAVTLHCTIRYKGTFSAENISESLSGKGFSQLV